MTYRQIVEKAEEFLKEKHGTPLRGAEIAAHLRTLMQQGIIDQHPNNVIYVYLSKAANKDDESMIISAGPSGGYTLYKEEEQNTPAIGTEPPQVAQEIRILEKHMYPLLKAWLEASDYVASDISGLRSGGYWGNPDLLGVSRIEILGATEFELASVEVKISDANWEKFIFEAISHKRFANRSWYCFRTTDPFLPLPKGMAYYAERYRIGIIQVYLKDSEIQSMNDGNVDPIEFLERVQERVRALYEPVPMQEKRAFLDRLNVTMSLKIAP